MPVQSFQHDPHIAPRRIAVVADDAMLEHILAPAIDALALTRVSTAERPDIVLWADAPKDEIDALLDAAADGDLMLVIAVSTEALDQWSFAIGVPGVDLVPKADHEALVRAVARTPTHRAAVTREGASDDPVQRLRELGSEVARIAQALAALGPTGGVADRRQGYRGEAGDGEFLTAPAIRQMIRARRVRDQYFAAELFADPAWDILLDLMAARLEGRDVAVSSLCIAAAVPPTTALRWISAMTEQGMLVRTADADDRRRVFIRLSTDTAERMAACLSALQRSGAVA